jgi:hypothetical protein
VSKGVWKLRKKSNGVRENRTEDITHDSQYTPPTARPFICFVFFRNWLYINIKSFFSAPTMKNNYMSLLVEFLSAFLFVLSFTGVTSFLIIFFFLFLTFGFFIFIFHSRQLNWRDRLNGATCQNLIRLIWCTTARPPPVLESVKIAKKYKIGQGGIDLCTWNCNHHT